MGFEVEPAAPGTAQVPEARPVTAPAPRPLGRRVRALAARSMHPFAHGHQTPLEALVAAHRAAHPRADVRLLHQAYEVAEREHRGQQRTSGEPFITHPVAVAGILAELGMDTTTLVAALLHDTVEDTGYTLEQAREDFGDQVAHLVDGVTKLDKVQYGDSAQAETIRKMIVAMSRDIRVLVIKLADRLHNMRTLRYVPAHKQERTARATLEVLETLGPDALDLGTLTVPWVAADRVDDPGPPRLLQRPARGIVCLFAADDRLGA